jgi:hypothetical protein
MVDSIKSSSDRFDLIQATGRQEISKSWRRLSEKTKLQLISTGQYSKDGANIAVVDEYAGDRVHDLAFDLGILRLCLSVKLPSINAPGSEVSSDALTDEVTQSSGSLLYQNVASDPVFLRLALYALKHHEIAKLLVSIPYKKPPNLLWGAAKSISFALIFIALLIASPAILVNSLANIFTGRIEDAVLGFYSLGLLIIFIRFHKNKSDRSKLSDQAKIIDRQERTLNAWYQLDNTRSNGDWSITGASAHNYFISMQKEGLIVPIVLFDICEALRFSYREQYVK